MLLPYMCHHKYVPLILLITSCALIGEYFKIYATDEIAAMNDVARNTVHR